MAGVAPPPLAVLAPFAAAAGDVDSEAAEARRHVNPAVIRSAAERIRNDIRRTPLWRLPGAALGIGCAEVWLKLEHLQVSGSFKARGMFNRLRSHKVPSTGVIIASGGNAGIAVAVAARALGVRCEVFVPEVTPPSKRQRLLDVLLRDMSHRIRHLEGGFFSHRTAPHLPRLRC